MSLSFFFRADESSMISRNVMGQNLYVHNVSAPNVPRIVNIQTSKDAPAPRSSRKTSHISKPASANSKIQTSRLRQ